jgi:hypothetical protein
MDVSRLNPRTIVVSLLVVVAIVGFVVGRRGAHAVAPETMVAASVASVVLNYPSTWQQVASPPSLPGFAITNELALAPGGNPGHAGLLAGGLAQNEPAPLPASLVALFPAPPRADVVSTVGGEAYRYAGVHVTGFDHALTLFAIPNPRGEETDLACYASQGSSGDLRTCEHIVATATLVGQTQSVDLAPNQAYARGLTTAIALLDRQRVTMRREMSQQAPGLTLQRMASRLAGVFGQAVKSLASLGPSLAVGRAHAALAASLLQAEDAYNAFAAAIAEGGPAGVTAARQQVYASEASVDKSLQGFALLGYT